MTVRKKLKRVLEQYSDTDPNGLLIVASVYNSLKYLGAINPLWQVIKDMIILFRIAFIEIADYS